MWVSGIKTVLLKTPTKYWEFFPTLFVKTTDFILHVRSNMVWSLVWWLDHIHVLWSLSQSEYKICVIIGYAHSASALGDSSNLIGSLS